MMKKEAFLKIFAKTFKSLLPFPLKLCHLGEGSGKNFLNEVFFFSSTSTLLFRTIYKPAKFGGSCIEESTWVKIDENNKLIWETEDCTLCKEHCNYHDTNVINWPLIEYPGKDRKCVGYCPCKKQPSFNIIQL